MIYEKKNTTKELPILAFQSAQELRTWPMKNYATPEGMRLRIYKKHSGVKSLIFEEGRENDARRTQSGGNE